MVAQGFSVTFAERFWAKVRKSEGCWIWIGQINNCGYGRISNGAGNQMTYAHRASWMLHFGPIEGRLEVCHDCPGGDNPACVRPEHLWVADHHSNILDVCAKKGLNIGERNGRCKLSEEQVLEIRALVASGHRKRLIAQDFAIDERTVTLIANRRIWRHI